MRSVIIELRKRNSTLYFFGLYNLIMGIICLILANTDDQQILGISRWIKPMKFFLSVWLMIWTMDWLLFYLEKKKQVRLISWIMVVSLFVENLVITVQSFRMQPSHFNVKTAIDGMLFGIMGIFIIIFTVAVVWTVILFLKQRNYLIPASYLWGIRFGIIFFLIFSVEGGFMLSNMGHTVGSKDGGPGLPIVNWSTAYGDLRIAHFLGMHALQILPLAGYYIFKKPASIIVFSVIYFCIVTVVLIMALRGMPLTV